MDGGCQVRFEMLHIFLIEVPAARQSEHVVCASRTRVWLVIS